LSLPIVFATFVLV